MSGLRVSNPAVGAISFALCAFHLYHGMPDPEVQEFVLDLFPDVIGLAYLLVADLHMGREGRDPVSD